MSARHLTMISLGGVIGTGLFVSSGETVHTAGPLGAIIAYAVGSLLVYCVMLCLGELSVAMPYAGSFHMYARKFIGPGTGFAVAILYWLNWAVALASEFTAAGMLMKFWFPNSPEWVWSAIFMVAILALNLMSVRMYGESEFWFSSIKVVAIVAFIVIGALAISGIIPMSSEVTGAQGAPWFTNFYADGWFPTGIIPIFSTLLTVIFAFSGTEVVGVAAGETKDPHTAIPKAVRTTVFRLVIFFIGSIGVMAALIPWHKSGVSTSPFVMVFQSIGIPYAADIMNFVVLTAVVSAANSGMYVCARMVWSLGKDDMLPRVLARTTKKGVPVYAVLVSMAGSMVCLLSSVFAADTVYLALVSISGLATLVVWGSVVVCQILFRRSLAREGKSEKDLAYTVPWYPFVPILAIVLTIVVVVLVLFDASQRETLLYMIPFTALCYAYYYVRKWVKDKREKK
ncbi:amino acid permease [Alloscardovia theropitheci]|uniref:Amino acid permease n=2 Tax=Alloscardovia theropitheci TaxID=2496842 RepID=A0A4R0QQ32_9BIFI|nr:amino acid permease [Alloscardovia theropitheci]TCD54392.1 amino acid permease [Alloscardovia theropitheci]